MRSVAPLALRGLMRRFGNQFATTERIVTSTQMKFLFLGHERNSCGQSNAYQ